MVRHNSDRPRVAVNSLPTDLRCRLTRDQLAVALSAAGYPISSATLATRVSRGEGPPHAVWGSRVYYRWGDALEWAKSCYRPPNAQRARDGRDT
jgi:hypothetical protein